jgi:hypothetical protein
VALDGAGRALLVNAETAKGALPLVGR